MIDDDLAMSALAVLAMATRGKRRRRVPPPPTRNYFTEDMSGTVYYVDAKGTRRKASEEQIDEYRRLKATSDSPQGGGE